MGEAIERGERPEWEVSVQLIAEKDAAALGVDLFDSTKLVPEEVVPLRRIGRLVLDRNPDSASSEVEEVVFHPAHFVPGIDFSSDTLSPQRASSDDCFGQAALFWRSQSEIEKLHIVYAFGVELSQVESREVRTRMVENLAFVDRGLASAVAMDVGVRAPKCPKTSPSLAASPALRMVHDTPSPVATRNVALLVAKADDPVIADVAARLEKVGVRTTVIAASLVDAPEAAPWKTQTLATSASVFFDAVLLAPSAEAMDARAAAFVREAFDHGKAIGAFGKGTACLRAAGLSVHPREGVLEGGAHALAAVLKGVLEAMGHHRVWSRTDWLPHVSP